MTSKPTIQIALTAGQKQQIEKATGKVVTTLTLQPLEARLAPSLSSN